jgi:antitoxin FitA
MTTLMIPLPEEQLERLKARATQAGVTPEELVRATLEEWLGQPADDFKKAADYVFRKNADLYRRLA